MKWNQLDDMAVADVASQGFEGKKKVQMQRVAGTTELKQGIVQGNRILAREEKEE